MIKKSFLITFTLLCAVAQGAVADDYANSYVNCSWNDTDKKVESHLEPCSAFAEITGSSDGWEALQEPFYIVRGDASREVLNVTAPTVHLILADGATLNVKHIKLEKGHTLHVHSQQAVGQALGKLTVNNDLYSGAQGRDEVRIKHELATRNKTGQ